MLKGGIESITPEDHSNDDVEIIDGPVEKKAKGKHGQVIAVKRGIEHFANRAFTKEETEKANVKMLRYFVHSNVPFSSSENYFFLKWINFVKPSYSPATQYVLMERLLPVEEAWAFTEDMKQLEGRKNLTYLIDGWEDILHRSVYGCMLAEVGKYPVVLGFEELTGIHATADNIIVVADKALKKKKVDPMNILAACTDNPTTMQAFH
ncbi:hypothetical protein CVT25_000319 [Psilocybe cyanescens]|uniref:DUF659 domain-containing protein n=1 Tax=Psilocybe cyanescens TaxID=93625 RepID=A0A409XEX8_PSICY|nr:hypothetical protein CVT25_000319 [Psilocybe cyanescens]